jgi:serine/threonine-protein kinase ULK4
MANQKDIMESLLPVIIKKVESKSADIRFQSLKAFTDFITQFLCDDKIYSTEDNSETTQAINELILKKLFPHYGLILSDNDPMPLFGLKLLSVVVERNSAFVVILSKLKLIEVLFSYFEVNHSKFNAFTIKIIRAIINSREISLQDLMALNIVDKMNGILKDVMQSNQEWCTDHLLEIINEILHMASEVKKSEENNISTAP